MSDENKIKVYVYSDIDPNEIKNKLSELEEWVERNQNYSNGNNNQLWLLKAVLREISDFEYRKYIGEQVDVGGFWQYIEQKLDGKMDGKKEKKEYLCDDCSELNAFPCKHSIVSYKQERLGLNGKECGYFKPKKDSGGEKEGTPIMAEVVVETRTEGEGTHPDSKPPEPKHATCVECKYYFLKNHFYSLNRCNQCEHNELFEPKEPSENDYRTLMDELKEEPEFRLGREYERKELIAEFVNDWKQVFKIIKSHWMSGYQWTRKEANIIEDFDKKWEARSK